MFSWTFPAIDLKDYEWLSMRIGQTSGVATTGLRVYIRNNGVWLPSVAITDHGQIPQPMSMCQLAPCGFPQVYEHMGTVRVPLSALGAHDSVSGVAFVFQGKSAGKDFLIDNLEFSEWVNKP
ncbi:hypothetical protein [Nannocystis pusilla]|uniref:hypothetical protein n=1 Tax=Nannocystis pusilla TaxID=889268 RepID=UPI003B79B792